MAMRWTKMYGTEDGNDGNVLVEIKSKEKQNASTASRVGSLPYLCSFLFV